MYWNFFLDATANPKPMHAWYHSGTKTHILKTLFAQETYKFSVGLKRQHANGAWKADTTCKVRQVCLPAHLTVTQLVARLGQEFAVQGDVILDSGLEAIPASTTVRALVAAKKYVGVSRIYLGISKEVCSTFYPCIWTSCNCFSHTKLMHMYNVYTMHTPRPNFSIFSSPLPGGVIFNQGHNMHAGICDISDLYTVFGLHSIHTRCIL